MHNNIVKHSATVRGFASSVIILLKTLAVCHAVTSLYHTLTVRDKIRII